MPHRLPVAGALALLAVLAGPSSAQAQAAGKFPPDSLVNLKVIPKDTPVREVIGIMRGFSIGLGVRCQYCHVGEEGKPLATFDFVSDEKRTKKVARQMLAMVSEIDQRIDTIPDRPRPEVAVTCRTCHRGVSRPVPLATIKVDASKAGGADSAARSYEALRERYYGRDAYDFGEGTLNAAALELARDKRYDLAFPLVDLNDRQFPNAAGIAVFRGDLELMRGDTTAAATAWRTALARDPKNQEAAARLKEVKRPAS